MSLDLNKVSTKFQLDWPANNRIIAESLFSHFLGSLFSNFWYDLWDHRTCLCTKFEVLGTNENRIMSNILGNTGMVAKATKFLYLEDESWPKQSLYQVSTWLASKQQNYCIVFVFSLFGVFVFQLFKMLGNTGMVAKATKFLYLEDEFWPK